MVRSNRVHAALLVATGALSITAVEFLIPCARAQKAPSTHEWKDLLTAHRIDGSKLRHGFRSGARRGSGGGSADLAVDSPPVLMDGHTVREGNAKGSAPGTDWNEDYDFTRPTTGDNAIRFELPLKAPRNGLPGQLSVDVVIFPCRNRTGTLLGGEDMPPAPSARVWIDDVLIGDPGSASTAGPVVAWFSVENLESFLGTGSFDWLAVADFNAFSLSDTDGDGFPDIGLETRGGQVILRSTPTIDEVGASLIEFFAGNVNRLNVYEPAGSLPPARSGYGGMQAGETGVTRPWCFRME